MGTEAPSRWDHFKERVKRVSRSAKWVSSSLFAALLVLWAIAPSKADGLVKLLGELAKDVVAPVAWPAAIVIVAVLLDRAGVFRAVADRLPSLKSLRGPGFEAGFFGKSREEGESGTAESPEQLK